MPLYEQQTTALLDQIDELTLVRIVYVSSLSLTNRLQSKVFEAIQHDARHYNKVHGITGTLCYGNGCFLQCVEGEKMDLLPVLQSLFDDKRHNTTKILLIKPIKERLFSNWGVRLLFLERWLWSPDTKKQAISLAEFIPLRPYDWSIEYTERFLVTVRQLTSPAHARTNGIQLNAIGNLMRHVLGPHQVFIFVQGLLSILAIISVYCLYTSFYM
ncbi:BLUF domain-containing protein [Psychrobacter lutiphocae]|uniref:BLUF domain-containing protein n=1 Tax=Psychrobacter lutiphocae TaxID=540500 RepID=UPI00035ECF42|nr:BLUF domain-containing protein [Psychrobacter lutiphocae]